MKSLAEMSLWLVPAVLMYLAPSQANSERLAWVDA
jgi:hypothetical protein